MSDIQDPQGMRNIQTLLEEAYDEFRQEIRKAADVLNESEAPRKRADALLDLYNKLSRYYNRVDGSIAQEEALGHLEDATWRRWMGDTAYSALTMTANAFEFLQSRASSAGLEPSDFVPDPTAMKEIQRLAVEMTDDDKISDLRQRFVQLSLPTSGFHLHPKVRRGAPGHEKGAATGASSKASYKVDRNSLSVEGMDSEHLKDVLKSAALKGPAGSSAPATAAPADKLMRPEPAAPQGAFKTWLSNTSSRVVGGVAVAGVVGVGGGLWALVKVIWPWLMAAG